ncbi:MAG: hypothetical protein E5Y26_11440 [Mesorhizobium sp.]|nr:MAG: hypothetical protein E5Y26_11440 [Mesorhizobium sp.]
MGFERAPLRVEIGALLDRLIDIVGLLFFVLSAACGVSAKAGGRNSGGLKFSLALDAISRERGSLGQLIQISAIATISPMATMATFVPIPA